MNVLIIDDHPIFVSALETLLKRIHANMRTDTACSVAEAIGRLDGSADYQLVLLDLHMPGLDGFAFMQILEQRRINASVIIVSSSEDPETVRASIAAGAVGFIPKSFRTDRIRQAIEQVLAGGIFVPEGLNLQAMLPLRFASPDEKNARMMRCAELGISRKHYQVLLGMAEGLTNKEIAEKLHISVHTVKAHNAILFERLHTDNRMDTVMQAIRLGLIDQ